MCVCRTKTRQQLLCYVHFHHVAVHAFTATCLEHDQCRLKLALHGHHDVARAPPALQRHGPQRRRALGPRRNALRHNSGCGCEALHHLHSQCAFELLQLLQRGFVLLQCTKRVDERPHYTKPTVTSSLTASSYSSSSHRSSSTSFGWASTFVGVPLGPPASPRRCTKR